MFGLELVVIIGAVIVACDALARRSGITRPILLVGAGVALGFVPALREVHLPPDVILLVFLPVLLYWEAITTSLRKIRATLRGVVLTSTVLVVITAGTVATAAHLLGMAWGPAWVLGAALAPTDATAVGALARSLPRRPMTVLRAESLVNDGTALVVYGVAVGVTLGEETLSPTHVAGLVAVSYVGGILIGIACAAVSVLARKYARDTLQNNVIMLLTPFTAYLFAELVDASGVLAVVVAGLILSQYGPRVATAAARWQSTSFWVLATYLINATLFVLVGIEANSAVRNLDAGELRKGVVAVAVVYAVLLATRYLFLLLSAYAIRLIDRRPSQRTRRVSGRARVVSAVAGFRGAVSLAVALSVPTTLQSGAPFPDRDLIVFITAGVVSATLVINGLLLAPTIRWANFPADDGVERERILAQITATEEALDALPGIAEQLRVSDVSTERLRSEYTEKLDVLRAVENGDPAAEQPESVMLNNEQVALRRALLAHKRATVLRLRDQQIIDDTVLRPIQAGLDVEELRLGRLDID